MRSRQTIRRRLGSDRPYCTSVAKGRAVLESLESRRLLASIAGTVYDDANGNGQFDLGESGLAGWEVKLFDDQTDEIGSTTTDANGSYAFTNLPDWASYAVGVSGEAGWQPSTAATSELLSPFDGSVEYHFGQTQSILISGRVYDDQNGDGMRDPGETGIFEGETVYIDLNQNGELDSDEPFDVTSGGNYQIGGLPGGTYLVRQVQPADRVITDGPHLLVVTDLSHETNVDFGNAYFPSVSGQVFHDADSDGVQDPSEAILSGWTVYLDENNNNLLDDGESSAVTDGLGAFTMAEVVPGGYVLRVQTPSGWHQTTPQASVFAVPSTNSNAALGVNTTAAVAIPGADPSFGNAGAVLAPISAEYSRAAALPGGMTAVLAAGGGRVHVFNPDGSPATSFGGTGSMNIDWEEPIGYGLAIAAQADGKFVVMGPTFTGFGLHFGVVRFNPDGAQDPSFGGGDGSAILDLSAFGGFPVGIPLTATVGPDGKIYIGGYVIDGSGLLQAVIGRLNPDGTPDDIWGPGGVKTVDVGSEGWIDVVRVDASGRVVVMGQPSGGTGIHLITRYNADGSLDTTFGTNGVVHADGSAQNNSLAVTTDGKIVTSSAFGYTDQATGAWIDFIRVRRYLDDGTLDASFGGGEVDIDWGTINPTVQVLVQSDNKVVVSGALPDVEGTPFIIRRLNADGSSDTSFGQNGQAVFGHGLGSIVWSDLVLHEEHFTHIGGTDRGALITQWLAAPAPAPQLSISGPTHGRRNRMFNFDLLVDDPTSEQGDEFTYLIDWDGDGIVDEVVTGKDKKKIRHRYTVSGTYTINVWVVNSSGVTSAVASTIVTVA